MAENIEFRLKVIEDKLGVALDQNAQKAKDLNDVLKVAAGTFAGNVAVGAFKVLGDAVSKTTGFILDSVKAASESEASLNKLEVALAKTGQFTRQAVESFSDFADEIERTTVFEDDAVISAGSLIQTLGRLDKDALKPATQAAIDLSAALDIDLQTAATLVGKAANGNITALQKLGVEVKRGVTDAETFANALKALDDRFSGAAAAQAKTFSGALIQLKNVFNGVQESIGGVIAKNPAVVAAFTVLRDAIVNAGKVSTEFLTNFNFTSAFNIALTSFEIFVSAIDNIFRGIKIVFNSAQIPIQALALVYSEAISRITSVASSLPFVGDTFKTVSEKAAESVRFLKDSIKTDTDDISNALNGETFLGNFSKGIDLARQQIIKLSAEAQLQGPKIKNALKPGTDKTTQEDEETIRRQEDLNNALLDLDRQYAIEKASLDEANRVAEKERFFIKQEEDIVALQEFELAKSDVQYQAQLDRNKLIKSPQEQALADQKALQEREIRNERIRQKTKDEIRRQELDDQRAFFAAATSLSSSKNKELAAIGKAAAIAEIAINTPRAVASSFAFGSRTGGPPLGFAFAAIAATAMAAQAAKVAGVQGFANGGVIGNSNGATMGGDNAIATVRTGELVLNASQQKTLFDAINSGNIGSNQPIVIQIDGREIARAVRNQVQQGYSLA